MTIEERFEHTGGVLTATAEIQQRQAVSVGELTEAITRGVDSSDARMKRLEENLDGLIRAIAVEHTNGKSKL